MKKILLLLTILSVSVMTTACINNLAIQELNNKAELYMGNGDVESAICRLKSSLDLDNEVYQTHYNLAVAYNTIGEYESSIEEIKKTLELKPDFADAFFTLAASQEALTYQVIENFVDEEGNQITPDQETKSEFINKATETVDSYNSYLSRKTDAKDAELINNKIKELNNRIKEYSEVSE